ncbi:MAG: glycosyltransferase, partial [Gammaproteobacteria bacterium]|nr:glycosyltransferase [Gammaproteobacteria bacterium]
YPFIQKGFCAYENLLETYPKLIHVGNPSAIVPVKKPRELTQQKLKSLSFGGSGGARQLNRLMQALIETHALKDCEIWHIIGDYDDHMLKLNGEGIKIERYNDNIQEAYQWADLAITRSGAMTLTELTLAGLPALLMPFPFATHDHQKKNAAYYVSKGAAWMCDDSPEGIVEQVESIQKNPKKYNEMASSMYDMIPKISSDQKIVSLLLKTKAV